MYSENGFILNYLCKKIKQIGSFENTKTLDKFYNFSDCNKLEPSLTRNRLKNLEFFIL